LEIKSTALYLDQRGQEAMSHPSSIHYVIL